MACAQSEFPFLMKLILPWCSTNWGLWAQHLLSVSIDSNGPLLTRVFVGEGGTIQVQSGPDWIQLQFRIWKKTSLNNLSSDAKTHVDSNSCWIGSLNTKCAQTLHLGAQRAIGFWLLHGIGPYSGRMPKKTLSLSCPFCKIRSPSWLFGPRNYSCAYSKS